MSRPDEPLSQCKSRAMQNKDLSWFSLVGLLHLHGFMQHRIEGGVLGGNRSDAKGFQSGLKGGPDTVQTL